MLALLPSTLGGWRMGKSKPSFIVPDYPEKPESKRAI